ncbi:MAG: ABC transporter ATP-binding protein [Magnetospirillum sp.]|nr:ABC transporter ATP-binding protein [Magnetospirillum sp.]
MAPLLQVEGLRKWFDITRGVFGRKVGQVKAVDDVSFTVRSREVLGLAGESGSGKTTIGRSVLRLVEPSAGRVVFDGTDVTSLNTADLRRFRRRMQIIFQDPLAALNPQMTIEEVLSEPLIVQGIGRSDADRRNRAVELLDSVSLSSDYLKRRPGEMSGGQRQRIVIARALAVNPEFIVADEPVSALDVSIQAQIIALLIELKGRLGLSMLFISHDLAAMEYISDRIAVLYLGRVMEIGPSSEVCGNFKHPYTEMLISAVPQPEPGYQRKIFPAGEIPSAASPPSGCVFRTRCSYARPECAQIVPQLRKVAEDHYTACIRDDLSLSRVLL